MKVTKLFDYLVVHENGTVIDGKYNILFDNISDGATVQLVRIADQTAAATATVNNHQVSIDETVLDEGVYRLEADGASCLVEIKHDTIFRAYHCEYVEMSRLWNCMRTLFDKQQEIEALCSRAISGFVTE